MTAPPSSRDGVTPEDHASDSNRLVGLCAPPGVLPVAFKALTFAFAHAIVKSP